MTDYEQRMAALGIGRGALAAGFADDTVPGAKAPRARSTGPMGPRVPVPKVLEDLTALNPPRSEANIAGGRNGGRKRHGLKMT